MSENASYEIIPVDAGRRWRAALETVPEHDVYHTREYQAVENPLARGAPFLFAMGAFGETAVLPILVRAVREVPGLEASDARDGASAYGYPGALTSASEPSAPFRLAFQRMLSEALDELGLVSLFLRQSPLYETTWLFEGFGEVRCPGRTVLVDLRMPEEEIRGGMREAHRRSVRKTEQLDPVFRADPQMEGLDDFTAVYEETMRRNGATEAYFFDRTYFEELKGNLGVGAMLVHVDVGGTTASAALLLAHGKMLHYHLGGTRTDRLETGAARYLLDRVVWWGRSQGFHWYHLGGGVGGREDSLFQFKSGFSKLRPSYHIVSRIQDSDRYDELVNARRPPPGSAFFPLYRSLASD
jgi:hypothetical protein